MTIPAGIRLGILYSANGQGQRGSSDLNGMPAVYISMTVTPVSPSP